jgi:hypothetical protein
MVARVCGLNGATPAVTGGKTGSGVYVALGLGEYDLIEGLAHL